MKRRELTEEQRRVLEEGATERPFTGRYVDTKTPGVYVCAGCGEQLFSSKSKFDSGSGWPSFTSAIEAAQVEMIPDDSHGMVRTEIRCASCQGHLGHVFDDGPGETGQRFCVNSASLDLMEDEDSES